MNVQLTVANQTNTKPSNFDHMFRTGSRRLLNGSTSSIVYSPLRNNMHSLLPTCQIMTLSHPSSSSSSHPWTPMNSISNRYLISNMISREFSTDNNPSSYKNTKKRKKGLQEELDSALAKGGERILAVQEIPKYSERLWLMIKSVPSVVNSGSKSVLQGFYILLTDPSRAYHWSIVMKGKVMEEVRHYWLGSKLLYADVSTSFRILRRVVTGNSLSRREERQLQRTFSDLVRLVPFSFFIIIPFMELLLPVALKLFPNMLPSTFQASYQREENMKKQLKLRLALADFLQGTVKDVLKKTRDSEAETDETRSTASDVLHFIERAQSGEPLTSAETLKFATLFSDELMLDNISRPQLVGMSRFMGLTPYGTDTWLRFQLRSKIRQLKRDDQQILWEGLDSLTKEELQNACTDRGMRSTGLTKGGYHRQMKQWLDLSISKSVPASLLIISRALNITASERPEVALAASMSSMDEEVVTEVALEAATGDESGDIRELQFKSIKYQNEMIADEEKERETLKKKEESKLKEEGVTEELLLEKELEKEMITDVDVMTDTYAEPVLDTVLQKGFRELTLDEVSALESLVFTSSVQKERQSLVKMKQLKSDMDTEQLLSSGRIGYKKPKGNKSAIRMMDKLESMIGSLEDELQKVDDSIGDTLNHLDLDNDGVLTAEELKNAIKDILAKHNTDEDANWAVSQIDENKDGKVTVTELVDWIEKRTNLMELTGKDNKQV